MRRILTGRKAIRRAIQSTEILEQLLNAANPRAEFDAILAHYVMTCTHKPRQQASPKDHGH